MPIQLRITSLCLSLVVLAAGCAVPAGSSPDRVLRYDRPAQTWNEALPVGNGRLGAMVFGGVPRERIQFNEETLWTGGPHDYAHPGASDTCERSGSSCSPASPGRPRRWPWTAS